MPGHLSWSMVELSLRAARTIWLASTRPDGRPHAVPMWFVWDGGSPYLMSARRFQKVRNLEAQPAVVLHLGDGDDVVILEGTARLVTDDAEIGRVDQVWSAKYVDPHSGTRDTVRNEDTNLYRVDVDRVMAWSYGVVDTRTDWHGPLPDVARTTPEARRSGRVRDRRRP